MAREVDAPMLSDAELERLMIDLESDRVERKASLSDSKVVRENICALANDLPGHGLPGFIFIGVDNDGTPSGLAVTDELLRNLAQMRSDGNILPQPEITVERRCLKGHQVAVVKVMPALAPPVAYKGRVYVRVGPTRQVATREEERRLAERRRAQDLPFDHLPATGASLEDLDLDLFRREYLPNAVAPDVLAGNARSLEDQLRALRFSDERATPSHAALLVFGKDSQAWLPGAYVQFIRLDGDRLTDPVKDQKVVAGSLDALIRRLEEVFQAHISVAADVTGSVTEQRSPEYPLVALQQVYRNALCHRTYEGTNAPVRVTWYNSRIEIHSPGGLYGVVNPENILTGATDYRNPLLAEAMKVLGFVQRFGLGLPLARQELEKNGNPPLEFSFQPSSVLVTIRRRPS
jgi:ATP-dependent DNA helicase RecG